MPLFETIPYEVIEKEKNIEIRLYHNVLLASTKTPKNKYLDSGFNNVFNYISGQNESQSKISMTTPVVTYQDEDKMVTGFYVPSKYTKDSVPKPSSNQVFIQELKESYYVVIKFSGSWNDKNFEKHDQTLKEFIERKDLMTQSPRMILRYQPPFIPGVFRKNEIAYQIQKP